MIYDVVVVGGGPAGVTAALRARELGATVALIEAKRMGGTCTNDGCAPTRVLAKAARLMRDAEQFTTYGISDCDPNIDWKTLIARTQRVIYQIHEKKQLQDHLSGSKVEIIVGDGPAQFVDAHTLQLPNGQTVRGKKIIICAGGHPRRLNFPGSEWTMTSHDVWQLDKRPDAVAIIGAAATGCQLASVFSDFGAQVSLFDIAPRILAAEDDDVSQLIQGQFHKRGINVITSMTSLVQVEPVDKRYRLTYTRDDQEHSLLVDAVIMSVGWVGNIKSLNLEAAGVETNRGYITVNEYLQTSVAHILAAGDINGKEMLVQSAGHEGNHAAEVAVLGIEGMQHHRAYEVVPHGGFTDPEYASVGLTEAQAREQEAIAVATVQYADLDRAVIDGRTVGFCKLIVSRATEEILGVHVVGEQAVEITQIVAAGMVAGMSIQSLARLAIAYPTFTAIVGLAARQIIRELGMTPLAEEYRSLNILDLAEWERSDT